MALGFLVLLTCQFFGELAVNYFQLSLPGPVLGMVILFGLFFCAPGLHAKVQKTAHGLLRNLSLFFIPAGVGIMTLAPTLKKEGLTMVIIVAMGTMATALASAFCAEWLPKKVKGNR